MCGAFAFPEMDKKQPASESLAAHGSQLLIHSKPPSLSTRSVENKGCPCRAEPTLGSGPRQPSMGSALQGLPVQRGQIFATLRNACSATLAPTCPHQVPMALHVLCGKPRQCLDKKAPCLETIAVHGSRPLIHTKPPSLSTRDVENLRSYAWLNAGWRAERPAARLPRRLH